MQRMKSSMAIILVGCVLGTAGFVPGGYAGDVYGPAAGCGVDACGAQCGWYGGHGGLWSMVAQLGHDTHSAICCLIHCHPCYTADCGAGHAAGHPSQAATGDYPQSDLIEIVPRPWPPDYKEVAPPVGPEAFMQRQRHAYARRNSARQQAAMVDRSNGGSSGSATMNLMRRPTAESTLAAVRPPALDRSASSDNEPADIMATASDWNTTE